MNRAKDHTKDKSSKLGSVYNKFKKDNSQSAVVRNLYDHNASKDEKQKDINKEIIRRLRIQNKKLIEQVVKLKEEVKKARMNKAQVLLQVNELLKLINP